MQEQIKYKRVSTENKKLRTKVEVLKEQVQDLMNDRAEMVRAQ